MPSQEGANRGRSGSSTDVIQRARSVMAERYLRARVIPGHPLRVAELVASVDGAPWLVAVALLHDVVRDTNTRPYELEGRVESRVLRAVQLLSDTTGAGSYETRARGKRDRVARAEWGIALVFAADNLDRLRVLQAEPSSIAPQRRAHYRGCVELIAARQPALPWNTETAELAISVLG